MSSPVGVAGAGAAAPSLRLAAADVAAAWGSGGGRGRVAVCAPDEDALTLAWTAATRALAAAGVRAAEVGGLWWGTSRPPFAEGPSRALLATAIGLPDDAVGALLSGSPHAGIEALFAAADAVAAGTVGVGLVVVADAVVPALGSPFESRAGAAAAAFVLTAGEAPATLGPRLSRTRPVLDRYRGDGERGTREVYDARLFREQVFLPAVRDVGSRLASGDTPVTAWSLPDPDGRLGAAAARALGADEVSSKATSAAVGDAGAAAALLGALPALAAAGTVALVACGGGHASGTTITATAAVPGAADVADALAEGRDATYAEVLRARGELVAAGETVEMAVPPGSAAFVRGSVEMLGLLGARCVDCGTVSTPPSIHPTCVGCGGSKLEEVALPRRGTVHTFVINHTMPAPFLAPLPLAVVDLEDGSRVMLQGLGDEAGALAIGDTVDLVLRRYTVERGVPVYGFKVKRAAEVAAP